MAYTFPSDFSEPVSVLIQLGEDPARQRELPNYLDLELTKEHIPELIRIVKDIEIFMPDEDIGEYAEVYAPIHAWRALGQLKAEEAIPALVDLVIQTADWELDWVMEEIPDVMALIGPACISALADYVKQKEKTEWTTAVMSGALSEIGKMHPESRDVCVAALEEGLKNYEVNDPYVNASFIADLAGLNASESDELVRQAFERERVSLAMAGDYEDFQVRVGLLEKRKTPAKNYLAEEYGYLREMIEAQEKSNQLFDMIDPELKDILTGKKKEDK